MSRRTGIDPEEVSSDLRDAEDDITSEDVFGIEELDQVTEKVTLSDMPSLRLPIGIWADGHYHRELILEPYKTRHDRQLGELMNQAKPTLDGILGPFLPTVIESVDGLSIQDLAKKATTSPNLLIESMFLPDIIYTLFAMRIRNHGPEIAMSVNCPKCDFLNTDNPDKGVPNHLLDSSDVKIMITEPDKKALFRIKFDDPFKAYGDTITYMDIEPPRLHHLKALSKRGEKTPMDITLMYKMVRAIPECSMIATKSAPMTQGIYDELSASALRQLRKAVELLQTIGVDVRAEMSCQNCGHEWKTGVEWHSLRNFLFPSDPALSD